MGGRAGVTSSISGLGGLVPGRVCRVLGSSRDDRGIEVEGQAWWGPPQAPRLWTGAAPWDMCALPFLQEQCHLAIFRVTLFTRAAG